MKTEEKKNDRVPDAVLARLPRYYRCLRALIEEDVLKVNSSALSERLGIKASQIRQDLSRFGAFGQQGYGYNVKTLYARIGEIMNLRDDYSALIVGKGQLSEWISREPLLARHGIAFRGVLPPDEPEEIGAFCQKNRVDIVILASQPTDPLSLLGILSENGVRGVINYTGRDLPGRDGLSVFNVNPVDPLMLLCYRLGNPENNEKN